MATHPLDAACMFCNRPLGGEPEPVAVTLAVAGTDATGTYWAHGSCLQDATHHAIPLYLLSLVRDEAVYGTKPDSK